MTWPEAREAFAAKPSVVLLPVGAQEQHGHHLPLATDTLMVDEVCRRVAARCDGVLVAPGIPYGTSHNHAAYPGTVSVELDTLKRLIVDVGAELLRHGADVLLIVNGHGGNVQAVAAAAYDLRRLRPGAVVAQTMWPSAVHQAWKVLEGGISWHADESETSLMLHFFPDMVQMGKARNDPPSPLPFFEFTEEALAATKVDLGLPRTEALASSGAIGYAELATEAKGAAIVGEAVDGLVDVVQRLRQGWERLSPALTSGPAPDTAGRPAPDGGR